MTQIATLEEKIDELVRSLGGLERLRDLARLSSLDHLVNLHLLSHLTKLDKIEGLNHLESLEKLEELKKLDNLQMMENLSQLIQLENLAKLENLKSLDKLDYLKDIHEFRCFESLENLSQLERLAELDRLSQLDSLYKLSHLDKLEQLEGLDKLEWLKELSQLDRLETLTQISEFFNNHHEKLAKLKHLEALDNLALLDKLSQLDRLDKLDKLDELRNLDKLSELSQLDRLSALSEIPPPTPLPESQPVQNTISGPQIVEGVVKTQSKREILYYALSFFADLLKTTIVAGLLVFVLQTSDARRSISQAISYLGFGEGMQVGWALETLSKAAPNDFPRYLKDFEARVEQEIELVVSQRVPWTLDTRFGKLLQLWSYDFELQDFSLHELVKQKLTLRLEVAERKWMNRLDSEISYLMQRHTDSQKLSLWNQLKDLAVAGRWDALLAQSRSNPGDRFAVEASVIAMVHLQLSNPQNLADLMTE